MHYVKNLQFYGKNKGFFIKKEKKECFFKLNMGEYKIEHYCIEDE